MVCPSSQDLMSHCSMMVGELPLNAAKKGMKLMMRTIPWYSAASSPSLRTFSALLWKVSGQKNHGLGGCI